MFAVAMACSPRHRVTGMHSLQAQRQTAVFVSLFFDCKHERSQKTLAVSAPYRAVTAYCPFCELCQRA
ncbi:MAG: hypothetical protein QOJ51_5549 [Acidobacteriaceae bacterium]|jgi:hypothetical protein|nr:hypothetical protein [Acidobacteriaceae bacterium]MEA2262724.1 hypothetical protein [Acidobacteriaceae bacterium]